MNDEKEKGRRWEAPRWFRSAALVGLALAIVLALVYALLPQPVPVDLAVADVGAVVVAVEEDGMTRVRDRYVVSAPVAGTLRRVDLRAGDPVGEGAALARIEGPAPAVTDARTEEQLRIRLGAAEAGVERARALRDAAAAALVEAEDQVRRQEVLLSVGGGTESALGRARAALEARQAEARSAEFAVQAAEGEVADLRAALTRPAGSGGPALELRSPVAGAVLRVHRESGGAVAPGEPILEVGDPGALEIVVDLLSADAVRVPHGAEAEIEDWGGEGMLHARVRRIEPSGFTRISALGIEEQRVNVLLDPVGDEDRWSRLGDGFRVEVRILIDRAERVLRVPAGALLRSGDGWAVFREEDGRAVEAPVELGRRSQAEAEILSGLEEGARVIVYPGDRVADGVRVRER
jgi:HlyD family secretion protein